MINELLTLTQNMGKSKVIMTGTLLNTKKVSEKLYTASIKLSVQLNKGIYKDVYFSLKTADKSFFHQKSGKKVQITGNLSGEFWEKDNKRNQKIIIWVKEIQVNPSGWVNEIILTGIATKIEATKGANKNVLLSTKVDNNTLFTRIYMPLDDSLMNHMITVKSFLTANEFNGKYYPSFIGTESASLGLVQKKAKPTAAQSNPDQSALAASASGIEINIDDDEIPF